MDNIDKSHKSENLLSQMQEGMVVFDVNKERVGTIADIYRVDADAASNTLGSLDAHTGIPFPSEDELPASIRARLAQQGFLQVKAGGVIPDVYYVTPDQLATLNSREVFLGVTLAQLIKKVD